MSEPLLYRVEDLVTVLNLSRTVVFDLLRTQQIRSVKVGRSRRIPAAAVHDYIASLDVTGKAA